MNFQSPLPARDWLTALGAFLVFALAGCQDRPSPTEPPQMSPSMAVMESSAPVVNSLADPGNGTCDGTECTLREAIAYASSGATITFDVTGTITLAGGQLLIQKDLTINGPGATSLTVDGNSASRVITVAPGYTVAISGLTITGGYTTAVGGAGMWNQGNLTITDCAITGNDANYNRAGGIYNSGTLLVMSSSISGNFGHDIAGGIYSKTSTSATFINTTISDNRRSDGVNRATGIDVDGGILRIYQSTVTGHTRGVDIYSGSLDIKGSIVWGNSSKDVIASAIGTVSSLGYNLVGTTSNATFDATGDQTAVTVAGLDILALNDPGTTETHALLEDSPALDAIPPASCTDHTGATLSTDQRGVTRPQGSACDIGAYEMESVTLQDPAAPVVNTLADHADGSCDSGDCTLREAIGYASSGATITFASTLNGSISLGSPLVISTPLTIDGPGASIIAVKGTSERVFDIQPGGTSEVTIQGLTIRDGISETSGAGVLIQSGTVLLEDVAVMNNRVTVSSPSVFGGGIVVLGTSAVTIRRSSISNNRSSYHGAGIYVASGSALTVENSTISDNQASGYGGGLYSAGTVTVTNTTIALNNGGYGGGAFINGGSLAMAFGTVAFNRAASSSGGGIYALSGTVALTGTILGDNTAQGSYPDLGGSGVTASYTLIESAADAALFGISNGVNGNVVGSDPGFDSGLTTNGGPTNTVALGATSPALDHISSGTIGCGSTVDTDQRGVSRPQGSACDIGAYELAATGPAEDELDVSKTANTSITREYVWEISKGPDHDYRGFAGDSWTHTYEIEVQQNKDEEEPAYTDVSWSVSGIITIDNNTSVDATIEAVTDVISTDISATVDCEVTFPYTLTAGSTLECSYSSDLPDASSRTNTATVTTSGDVAGGTATASVDFSQATVVNGNPVVNVTDDNATPDDLTDDRESGELGDGEGFDYSLSFQCPAAESAEYVAGVYTETRVNTAAIDEYPAASDGATVTLTCYLPTTAKVVKTTTAGDEDIGQLPFSFGLYAPETFPGQDSPVETVSLDVAGEVSFTTELKAEGPWTVAEALPTGWVSTTDLTCTFVVDYPPLYDESNTSPAGQVLTCSFDNVEKSRVDLLKLTNGLETLSQSWSFALYEGADGFGGTPIASDATPPATLDFGPVDLDPAGTYTLCELNVPAGYSTFWQIDTDGDGVGDNTVIPYNPNADDDSPEDLGNRCIDLGSGTGIALSPGSTLHFVVNNAQPGGAPRSNGYWKNWNGCTTGGQAAAAEANGGWEEGFWLLEDVLNPSFGDGVTWDDILDDGFVFPITSCPVAVDILDKRKVGKPDEVADGKKQASDPLFNLAANLLAAQMNFGAGVCTTEAVQGWVIEAEALLDAYDFDGDGHDNLGKKSDDGARANELATLLDSYNTGMICGNGGD